MTDNFIAYFYRERLVVTVASVLIVAGGIFALTRLNVDAFPDVTPVQVEIDTDAQGLAPQEVEQQVTFPIENVMNSMSLNVYPLRKTICPPVSSRPWAPSRRERGRSISTRL